MILGSVGNMQKISTKLELISSLLGEKRSSTHGEQETLKTRQYSNLEENGSIIGELRKF